MLFQSDCDLGMFVQIPKRLGELTDAMATGHVINFEGNHGFLLSFFGKLP